MTSIELSDPQGLDEMVHSTLPALDVGGDSATSAGKALALLDAFAGTRSVLGVTELATRAALPKSTAYRLLVVLVQHGYVRRVGDRYCLTERVFEIGNQARSCRSTGLRQWAMPFMAELFAQTRETVHLAMLSGTDVLYLEKIFGHDGPRCDTSVGARRPAYATALGKAMLAYSDENAVEANLGIRFQRFTPYTLTTSAQLMRSLGRTADRGYAVDNEESSKGVTCVAVPIRDPQTNLAIAALSICSVSTRSLEQKYATIMIRTAELLSRRRIPA